jgi:superfamily II DNA/RNA helicase
LGAQVCAVFKRFTHGTRLRVRAVAGGTALRKSRETVSEVFDVLVATPNRLQKLVGVEQLSLAAVRLVVLDEADQLLDMGFLPLVGEVVEACPSWRQVALFSATFPPSLRTVAARLAPGADAIETGGAHRLVPSLRTRRVPVPDGRRPPVLARVLAEPVEGGTILFANTRDQVDAIALWATTTGWSVRVLRSEMDPLERKRNLAAFRAGEVPLLVATDVGARGLDLPAVGRVINVHLPREIDTYLHRAGRTARAGRVGEVVDLVTPRDAPLIERLSRRIPTG